MRRRRILIVGAHQQWRMESGLARAWRRMGHATRLIDDKVARRVMGHSLTQHWARWHARQFRPDFVFLSKCNALTLETVAAVAGDRPSATWVEDAPYWRHVDRPAVRHFVEVGRIANTCFVTGYEREWAALGTNAKFLPSAADPAIHPAPCTPDMRADLTFIGTGYDESRAEFLIALAREFLVKVWGSGWERWAERLDWGGRPVEGRDFSRAVSSAAIALGILPRIAEGATRYASNRMWITILGGGFYLGQGTEGVRGLLLDDVHCAWYTDLSSCVERARHYLSDPGQRERVRAAGERFVREYHTFDQRAANILEDREWTNPLG